MNMDKNRRNAYGVMLLVLIGCGIMAWVEGALRPVYPVKSGLKIAVLLGCVGLYTLLSGDREPFHVLRKAGAVRLAAPLALGVLVFLLGGYALLSPWLDLSAIPENLAAKEGITRETFPLAAAYITLCNSLIEEFFFRGFAYLSLAGRMRGAFLFSAVLFALYHTAMMLGWFPLPIFLLALAGLTAGGGLFNWLNARDGAIWTSWLVHMCANFAINTVGMLLFAQA